MTVFRVWAPNAKKVEVLVSGKRHAMKCGAGGWHFAEVAAAPGTDYAFRLDGGAPLPDPRSAWQPQGVHGPSRTLEHGAFEWSDQDWNARPFASGIVYELHVGTFTPAGTFAGVVDRLSHLVDLGVTHIELMPVAEFAGLRGWGYDGVDLFAPFHHYGRPANLKRLVDSCHHRGLAVILDVVYNHLGPVGNYLEKFAPYFTDRYHTPWGKAVNFDGSDSDEVRRFFCDNALMWLRDYHFDALRLDAADNMFDCSATHILEQLAREVHEMGIELGRNLAVVAETNTNDPRAVSPASVGGYGIDAQWNDDFHHALHVTLTGEKRGYYADFEPYVDLAKGLRDAYVYDGRFSGQMRRTRGRRARGPGYRYLAYAQTHDQVGNRAKGERISQLVSVGRQKIAAAIVLASPYVPLLFQGEEWGASSPFQYFMETEDAELRQKVREDRARDFAAFGWAADEIPDATVVEAFECSKLRWGEIAEGPHASVMRWYRDLIRLRRETPALMDGSREGVETFFDVRGEWFGFRRDGIWVVCSLASDRRRIEVSGADRILLASDSTISLSGGLLDMGPESVAIVAGSFE